MSLVIRDKQVFCGLTGSQRTPGFWHHTFILNHNKHITVIDIIIFMNSYNTFTCIFILVTNLCFFRYLEYGTELIRITNLYLLRSYTDDRLILIPISRRIHTYACIRRTYSGLPKDIYIYLPYTDTCLRLIIIQISQRTYT